jgi:phosphoribosylaminoimidazole-succinocarboxamide synthase
VYGGFCDTDALQPYLSSSQDVVLETHLPGIPLLARGKVRDIYDLRDRLLIVTTDRISAFDCILPTGIPGKGKVLTQLSRFWLEWLSDSVAHHLITADVNQYPAELEPYRSLLAGRSMLVHRADMLPVECVARGYLAGSGWKEYQATGAVCGIRLPAGLRESDALPEPLFTPATKATSGHDVNISFSEVERLVGAPLAAELRRLTLQIYTRAAAYARERGIIIADTKFEFGLFQDHLILADEVLTPDSSRFWPLDSYQPGRPQASYDKQYVRDYLESIGWDKKPPAPPLPADVVVRTAEKYRQAYLALTGRELE